MDQITLYFNDALQFFREGFQHVNALLGLLIAIYSAYQMSAWRNLAAVALGATVIHVVASVLLPVIDGNAAFHLPPLLEMGFWRDTLALFLGYIVAVAAFFFVKKNVLKGGH
jgi:hypothetical protein